MVKAVFIAKLSNPASHAVFEKVRDWSLTGMFTESLWIDSDVPSEVIRIRGSELKKLETKDWLMTLDQQEALRLFPLQVLKSEKSLVGVEELRSALSGYAKLSGELSNSINLIFPIAETVDAIAAYYPQNLNLIVLPVDSASPSKEIQEINKKSPQYFSNVAKELATISGLWHGMEEQIVNSSNIRINNNFNVMVVRSFVRYVDASLFVKSIVEKVLEGKNGALPVTRQANDPSKLLNELPKGEDLQQVKLTAAKFFEAQERLQFTVPKPTNGPKPLKVGIWKLIVYIWKWFLAWIRKAGKSMLSNEIFAFKKRITAKTQELFGDSSVFAVNFGGVTVHKYIEGMSVAEDEITLAIRKALPSSEMPGKPDPGSLWKELAEVSTSLVDAGVISKTSIQLPSIANVGRSVVTQPHLIAPNPFEKSFAIPATLPVKYAGQTIQSNDPLKARMLIRSLEQMRPGPNQVPSQIAALAQLRQDLQAWLTKQQSFMWQVGDSIANSIIEAWIAWESLSAVSITIPEDKLIEAEQKAQDGLVGMIKGTLAIVFGAIGLWLAQALFIFFTAGTWPVIAPWWPAALGIAGIVFGVWNLIAAARLRKPLHELFKIQHELNNEQEKIKYADSVRMSVMTSISNLKDYYLQWKVWSQIMSYFIHKAPDNVSASKNSELIGGAMGLPQSMNIARLASADDGSSSSLVEGIAGQFYRPGWLLALLKGVVDDNLDSYEQLCADSMVSTSSPLTKATEWIQSGEVLSAIRDTAGDRVQELATASSAFDSWTVETTNAVGDKSKTNGSAFIGELSTGLDTIPAASILIPAARVGTDRSKIDKELSACAFDERMNVSSDMARNLALKANMTDSRELDFIGIRFESTELLESNLIRMFNSDKSAAVEVESVQFDDEGPQA